MVVLSFFRLGDDFDVKNDLFGRSKCDLANVLAGVTRGHVLDGQSVPLGLSIVCEGRELKPVMVGMYPFVTDNQDLRVFRIIVMVFDTPNQLETKKSNLTINTNLT